MQKCLSVSFLLLHSSFLLFFYAYVFVVADVVTEIMICKKNMNVFNINMYNQ